jgi:hypothetical protein
MNINAANHRRGLKLVPVRLDGIGVIRLPQAIVELNKAIKQKFNFCNNYQESLSGDECASN